MTALLLARPASPLLLAKVVNRRRRPRGVAGLLPALLISGVLTALVAAVAGLTWFGPIEGFGSVWLENWLVSWPIAFPVIYVAGPSFLRLLVYISSPVESNAAIAPGLSFGDIAAASAHATERHGFTVLRNLKVREDFYRA